MSALEDVGREVDDAMYAFALAQQVMLRAGRRLLTARRRLAETQPHTLADVIELRRTPVITTLAELDEAAALETVPPPALGRNGLPDLMEWVNESPARARAAWIWVSTRGSSGDQQYDSALREQCHLFAKVILRNTELSEAEADQLDTGPDSRRLWLDRVVRR